MSFYENLKTICEERKTTPTTICKELGLSTALPTYWKSGKSPNSATIKKVADHLGVSVTELLEGQPSGPFFMGLSPEEARIIEAYRAASPERKESVMLLLGVEVEQKASGQVV